MGGAGCAPRLFGEAEGEIPGFFLSHFYTFFFLLFFFPIIVFSVLLGRTFFVYDTIEQRALCSSSFVLAVLYIGRQQHADGIRSTY